MIQKVHVSCSKKMHSRFYASGAAGFCFCRRDSISGAVPIRPRSLQKSREWEKTWVGKKVDASSIDQVAQFLPEGFVKHI